MGPWESSYDTRSKRAVLRCHCRGAPSHAGLRGGPGCGTRMGCHTAVFTANLDSIALMPCNPAIGGIAKGTSRA